MDLRVMGSEDGLSDRHYQWLGSLIEDRIGIRLPATKKTMVEGRLRKRVRSLGLNTLNDYGETLFEDGALADEFDHIIDLLTTNKTDFFREPEHFTALRDEVVPELLGGRRNTLPGRRLKLWSAASSIGAEAYSMAMVLDDLGRSRTDGISFSILATDINCEVLEIGARAIYPEEMVAPVPPALRRRYIMRSRDPDRQEVRIVPELRRLVQFERLNLIDKSYDVDQDVDVIFCRNVLIYFEKPTQNEVLRHLCSHLRPGGYLFLGHSETSVGTDLPGISQIRPTLLRREA